MDSVEVVVVGAGPTGLALACGLRLHGVRVRVIDTASGPATTSRANILHARGVEVLDRLGAVGDLRQHANDALQMTMYVGERPLTTMRFGEVEGARISALYVSQANIEAQLRRRLAELGVHVEWNAMLADVAPDADGVTATVGDGRTVRAGWLVGCDGAHSTVRKVSGIGFPGVSVVEQFLLADVHADWDRDRSGGAGWFHRDGILLAMPMREPGGTGDLWRVMADVPRTDADLDDEAVVDEFRRLLPVRAGVTDARIRDATWTSVFRIHRRLADDYRRGRVLLAGDAAHIHSPVGGQGMNTGIGDAENLSWKLALVVRGLAGSALLDTYQAERRSLAAGVLRNTTANTRLLVGAGPVTRLLRDRVFIPLLNLPPVQRRGTEGASQLWVSYRRGPLGGPRFGVRPRPGDRVPDRACLREDGSRTRLYDELDGRWALLVPRSAGDDGVTAARKRLGDHVDMLTAADESAGEVWLVRPDAHLAWRGRPDPDGLGRWLDNALQHGRRT